jgi:hypothetical protein
LRLSCNGKMFRQCQVGKIPHLPQFWRRLGPEGLRNDRPLGDGPVQKGICAMLLRHLYLVRAGLAAGLFSGLAFLGASTATAQSKPAAPVTSEPSSAPAGVTTETVSLIQARKAGDLDVVARGHGPERVHLSLHNRSTRRLNVVIPPGLVAASAAGQPGGAGGRGGMQSMGLGSAANREGAFGDFQGTSGPNGLQSVGALDGPRSREIAVPVGETIELNLPAVCLNFGWPTPTGRDKFTLVTVEEYTTNPRIRKALRSLATYGTSLGVAQSVMWRVCNDLPFEAMVEQGGKVMNTHEVALAARFVEALDASTGGDLVDPSALSTGRIFVQVHGEGALDAEARRLAGQLDGLRVLGLPVQVVESEGLPTAAAPAMMLNVILTAAKTGETRGAIVASACSVDGAWLPLGKVAFQDNSSVNVLDGATLSKVVDRAVAGAFVTVKPAHRTVGSTTLKVENRLPFTVTNLVVRAGTSAGAPPVAFQGVGVGPARSTLLPIQAATASLVERVEINGL